MTGHALKKPTRYSVDFCEVARKLCLIGYSDAELGSHFEVPLPVIMRWKAIYPEFAAAVAAGRDLADADVVDALRQRALGYRAPAVKFFQVAVKDPETKQTHIVVHQEPYIEHYPPDTHAAELWLAQRKPKYWKPRPAAMMIGEPDQNVVIVIQPVAVAGSTTAEVRGSADEKFVRRGEDPTTVEPPASEADTEIVIEGVAVPPDLDDATPPADKP